MLNINDYKTPIDPTWCPGCGNFSIFNALKQALIELDLSPDKVVITFDIGCNSNMADKIKCYGFKSLHGRSIPVASGISLANPKIKVIAIAGDGGMFEEGINHTIWAARSNYNITAILHNNQIFGLTTGQPTTLSQKGIKYRTTANGVVEEGLLTAQLMLVAKSTFVARAFAGDLPHLIKMMKSAIKHKGFGFLEVLQPCVTYNKFNTFEWFKQRVYKLDDKANYNPSNWDKAFKIASKWDNKIATGIIYQDKKSVPYPDKFPYRKASKSTPVEEVKNYSISGFIKEYE